MESAAASARRYISSKLLQPFRWMSSSMARNDALFSTASLWAVLILQQLGVCPPVAGRMPVSVAATARP
eukprot:2958532-Pleurochrysis_carterae.AAC.1